MSHLPYRLQVHEWTSISAPSFVQASNFAKDTGDFRSLSTTDLKVIALGIHLARNLNQDHLLRKEP